MPTDDRPIPAAPCPTCQRPLDARSGEVGRVVRCAGCGTRFRVVLSNAVSPVPDEADEPVRPRQTSRPGNPYDDGYGRFDEEVTPGRVAALTTMHFVYTGLLFVRGVLTLVLLRVYPTIVPGPDIPRGSRVVTDVLLAAMAVAAVPLLVAGVKSLRRRPTAWGWSLAGVILAATLLVASLALLAVTLAQSTVPTPFGIMCGLLYELVFWLGYVIPVGVLLGRPAAPPGSDEDGEPRP